MTADPKDEKEEKPGDEEEELVDDDASKLFFGDHLKNVVDKDLNGGSQDLDLPHESPSMQFFGESLDGERMEESEDSPPEGVGDPEVEKG